MKLTKSICIFIALCGQGLWSTDETYTLDEYLDSLGVTEQQNAGHMNISPTYDEKALYYVDLLESHPDIKTIAEIGFCIGHSSDVYLSTRSDITMVSFDVMYHWFNEAGKDYIDMKHAGRHQLFRGDSRVEVPKFVKNNKGTTFDLIIIDGGHEYQTALQDLLNMQKLARPDTILIMDDTEFEPVNRAWQECIRNGLVEELERRTESGFGWSRGRYLK